MSKAGKIWKGLVAGGAGLTALAALNARVARHRTETPESAFGGEHGEFLWKHGRVFYRVSGAAGAPPLVFVHGIGAGVSSFMWRRNFDALAARYRVYALDLLGFGASEKPANAPYSADLYVELIADFIREVATRPAHLAASSLGAAFAVRVADEHAAQVESLMLISPTGVGHLSARPDLPGAAFYGLLHSPVLGTSFYNAMTSERSIRDYARKQLFYDKRFVTPRLVAHYYAASHQPGAQHAIAAFLSGFLNTDTREAFARLAQRTTLVWGKQDRTNPVEQAATLLRINPRVRLEIFDRCRLMPQEEHHERFNALAGDLARTRSAAA